MLHFVVIFSMHTFATDSRPIVGFSMHDQRRGNVWIILQVTVITQVTGVAGSLHKTLLQIY